MSKETKLQRDTIVSMIVGCMWWIPVAFFAWKQLSIVVLWVSVGALAVTVGTALLTLYLIRRHHKYQKMHEDMLRENGFEPISEEKRTERFNDINC